MDLSKYHNLGLVGLENLGNTCFLNSCLQVLNNTYELNHFLESDECKNSIKKSLPESNFIEEWEDLRNVMWSGNGVVAPRKFVNSMQHMAKAKNRDLFTGWSQNDMPEFLQFFIESIHNSMSRSENVIINGKAKNGIDQVAIKCYEMIKNMYKNDYSEIYEMFYGINFSQLISIKTNETVSVVPESFFIIDLPIHSHEKKASTIYECFDLFTEPEYLEGDNAWYNEKTKQKEDVKKQYSFWKFPNILVILFKRFSMDGSHKISDHVDFPLEDLDLSKYVKGYNASKFKYDLYGVCNHVGNVSGGHYTAFVKNAQNQWNHFNDNRIEKIEKNELIISPSAYCLFYRKKNNLL